MACNYDDNYAITEQRRWGLPAVWQVLERHRAASAAARGSVAEPVVWCTEPHWGPGQTVGSDLRYHKPKERCDSGQNATTTRTISGNIQTHECFTLVGDELLVWSDPCGQSKGCCSSCCTLEGENGTWKLTNSEWTQSTKKHAQHLVLRIELEASKNMTFKTCCRVVKI